MGVSGGKGGVFACLSVLHRAALWLLLPRRNRVWVRTTGGPMNIQASRLQSALAIPASAAPTRSGVAPAAGVADAPVGPSTSTTVTISQAAKDLLAQSQASVSLSSQAMDLIQQRNPYGSTSGSTPGSAPSGTPDSSSQQAQVRKVMDNLITQHNNRQISDTQYQHDMAFYTRVSTAIG